MIFSHELRHLTRQRVYIGGGGTTTIIDRVIKEIEEIMVVSSMELIG